jgi:VanZ family protein
MRDRQLTFCPPAHGSTAAQWAPRIILLSLVVIIVSTLYPFKFVFTEPSSLLSKGTSKLDVLANIVLFVPLGFGLASALALRKSNPFTKFLAVLLLGGGLSLSIEILQTFLPGRDSTLWDVITNTTGTGVGFWLFVWGGHRFYRWIPPILGWFQAILNQLKLKYLIAAIVVYGVMAAMVMFSWQRLTLQGWDLAQPLSIGSTITVQLPHFLVAPGEEQQTTAWDGRVSDVLISDRALSPGDVSSLLANPHTVRQNTSVLARYPLRGNQDLQDSTGQSPNLVWQGSPSTIRSTGGVNLSEDQWLATSSPVSLINERIRNSAQFTLAVTLAAADPATVNWIHSSILAISPAVNTPVHFDHLWENSNLVLSQVGAELILRLGVSRTGWDRQSFTARIPDVFLDTSPHQIHISFAGFALRVTVDGIEKSFFDTTPNRYQIVFYALVLMPLAVLLSLLANRLQHRVLYLALVAGGSILPPLVLESLAINAVNRSLRETNLVLGFLIMGGTMLALKSRPAHPGWIQPGSMNQSSPKRMP